jgi:Flp pilus assembly protein TadB
MLQTILCLSSIPAHHASNPNFGLVVMGLALGFLLIGAGLYAALLFVMTPGGTGLGVLISLLGLLSIFGYIWLVVKVRRAKRAKQKAQKEAQKPAH